MKWSEIFPCYPFRLGIRKGWKVRIGSRKIYVDLPYIFPQFLSEAAYRYRVKGITREEFEKEREELLKHNQNLAFFDNKPIATLQLITPPFGDKEKPLLRCRVLWKNFFNYLDYVADSVARKIKGDGEKGLSSLYTFIYGNYFQLFYAKELPEPFDHHRLLEHFKRTARYTGEKNKIEDLLSRIEILSKKLEEWYENSYPSVKFYTIHIKMDIKGALKCLENMNVLAIYFYLRNILELFIKMFVYIQIAKNFGEASDIILRILYFYDRRIPELEEQRRRFLEERKARPKDREFKLRINSLPSFEKDFVKKMMKILSQKIGEMTYEELFEEMTKRGICVLGINKEVMEQFCKRNGVSFSLMQYWRACSYAIHQQTPLPFYSLLEVKGLRAFLEILVEDLIDALIKITNIPREILSKQKLVKKHILAEINLPKRQIFQKIEKVIYKHKKKIIKRMKQIIVNSRLHEDILFTPTTLSSLFELLGLGVTKIKDGTFQSDDMDEITLSIQAIGFKVAIDEEIRHTFNAFHSALNHFLEKIIPQFKSLSESERRGVTFYLLALYLPEIQKESLHRRN